jgi:hypothetical protein
MGSEYRWRYQVLPAARLVWSHFVSDFIRKVVTPETGRLSGTCGTVFVLETIDMNLSKP